MIPTCDLCHNAIARYYIHFAALRFTRRLCPPCYKHYPKPRPPGRHGLITNLPQSEDVHPNPETY